MHRPDTARLRAVAPRPALPPLTYGRGRCLALAVLLAAGAGPARAQPAAPPAPTMASPTVVVLVPAHQKPLGDQVRLAIQGHLGGAGFRVELQIIPKVGPSPASLRPLARRLAARPGVVAVIWFELALRAQAYLMVPGCGRMVIRDLEATHARARVESLGIIVGSAVKAVRQRPAAACPGPDAAGAPPPPPPPPPPLAPPPALRPASRWHLGAAFASDFFWLQTSFRSEMEYRPLVAGMALGSLGLRVDLGYALGPRWRIGLAGRLGWTRSDLRPAAVLSYEITARVQAAVLGRPRGLLSLYLGAELGAGQLHSVLPVGNNNERDTFAHGAGLLDGILGVAVGTPRLGWFLEVVPGLVFPNQTTFRLLLATGLRLYL